MLKKKLVKVRDYNKKKIQLYDIDKLKVCTISYNLEGARFTKIKVFFKKFVSISNLDFKNIDVLVVGLQEVKNTIKTKQLNKLPVLSQFPYIQIIGNKGIIRGSTRLIVFSKYKLKIETAIDNIKNTFKTIKNIIITNIQLPLVNNSNKSERKNTTNAIQFSVLNCHLPKDSLEKYITDSKLSKLKFKNNIILGDFNSRTEFKLNKTKKTPLTDKNKYKNSYDTILKELENKPLKELLDGAKIKAGIELTDTLHNYKKNKNIFKIYRELHNLNRTLSPNNNDLPQNPTYKINPKTGNYVYYKKKGKTKRLRVPSYADRILVTGKDILIEKYNTLSTIKLSDHLPIMGIYTIKKDSHKYKSDITIGNFTDSDDMPIASNDIGFVSQDTNFTYYEDMPKASIDTRVVSQEHINSVNNGNNTNKTPTNKTKPGTLNNTRVHNKLLPLQYQPTKQLTHAVTNKLTSSQIKLSTNATTTLRKPPPYKLKNTDKTKLTNTVPNSGLLPPLYQSQNTDKNKLTNTVPNYGSPPPSYKSQNTDKNKLTNTVPNSGSLSPSYKSTKLSTNATKTLSKTPPYQSQNTDNTTLTNTVTNSISPSPPPPPPSLPYKSIKTNLIKSNNKSNVKFLNGIKKQNDKPKKELTELQKRLNEIIKKQIIQALQTKKNTGNDENEKQNIAAKKIQLMWRKRINKKKIADIESLNKKINDLLKKRLLLILNKNSNKTDSINKNIEEIDNNIENLQKELELLLIKKTQKGGTKKLKIKKRRKIRKEKNTLSKNTLSKNTLSKKYVKKKICREKNTLSKKYVKKKICREKNM